MFRTFRGSRKSHASLLLSAHGIGRSQLGHPLASSYSGAHLHVRNSCRPDWFRWPVLNECVVARTTRRSQKRNRSLQESTSRSDSRDASLYPVFPRPDWVYWDGIEYWDSTRRHGKSSAKELKMCRTPSPGLDSVWRLRESSSPSGLREDASRLTRPCRRSHG